MIQKKVLNNLYSKIAKLLQSAKQQLVRSVNQTMVYTYYEIGRIIVEDEQQGKERAEYGKQVLEDLSRKLTQNFGKGFSVVNLRQMRAFYLVYSIQQKPSAELKTPHFKLSWSHYLKLMRIDDVTERQFYEIECFQNNWSLKELQRQYDSALYERLALSRDKEGTQPLARQGQMIKKATDMLKDPYVLEFLDLPEHQRYSESDLEQALIDKLEHFLLELGKGFTFVGRQVRFTFDEKHFKVDLVFFNRLLRCFVLIDLKIGELTHQDIGQMQMYVNYYDRFVRLPDENKTAGIILCKDKNDTLVEMTLPQDNDSIFASRYQTILPDKQTFIALLNQGM
jgi:predicted nuclease of restriction endonuclease-like (RecB) superfamily